MSDEVQVTPELLASLEALANAVPGGEWIPTIGSGHNVCTALVSESETQTPEPPFCERFWLADFDPDYFQEGGYTKPLPDHRAMLNYVQALHRDTVLALVKRIRALESGMVLDLSELPVGCHITLTQGVSFWTVSLSSGVECRTVYRSGTTPNEAYISALKAWREDG